MSFISKLQALYRGHCVRKKLKRLKESVQVNNIQISYKIWLQNETQGMNNEERHEDQNENEEEGTTTPPEEKEEVTLANGAIYKGSPFYRLKTKQDNGKEI